MNLEKTINDLIKYETEIINKLSANHWHPYFLIKEKFSNGVLDDEFKNCFCGFYIMNGPMGLNNFQKDEFFKLLSAKGNNLEKILRTLYEIPGYGGNRKLFLSFGTKLLHTIDNDLPIYDRNIADVLELQNQAVGTLETKVKNRISIYDELKNNFTLLLKNSQTTNFLENIRKEINEKSTENNLEWKNNLVSDVKLLDSSLWALYTIREKTGGNQKS